MLFINHNGWNDLKKQKALVKMHCLNFLQYDTSIWLENYISGARFKVLFVGLCTVEISIVVAFITLTIASCSVKDLETFHWLYCSNTWIYLNLSLIFCWVDNDTEDYLNDVKCGVIRQSNCFSGLRMKLPIISSDNGMLWIPLLQRSNMGEWKMVIIQLY